MAVGRVRENPDWVVADLLPMFYVLTDVVLKLKRAGETSVFGGAASTHFETAHRRRIRLDRGYGAESENHKKRYGKV